MCPFFATFILLILFLAPQFLICSATSWKVEFTPDIMELHMSTTESANLYMSNLNYDELQQYPGEFQIKSDNERLAIVNKRIAFSEITANGNWNGTFDIDAVFMGNLRIYVEMNRKNDNFTERSDQTLPVIITREEKIINHIFTGSVATLVSILYINFGAALDVSKLKGILKRPIGPSIGFFGQFVIMPVVSKKKRIISNF